MSRTPYARRDCRLGSKGRFARESLLAPSTPKAGLSGRLSSPFCKYAAETCSDKFASLMLPLLKGDVGELTEKGAAARGGAYGWRSRGRSAPCADDGRDAEEVV